LGRLRRLLLWVHLLSVLVVPNSWGWCPVAAALPGANADNLSVDSAGDAVLELQVHLGNGVFREDRGIGNITNSCRLDHVTNGESLDCLVLGCASGAVGAPDRLNVATTLLVTTVGRSLLDHICGLRELSGLDTRRRWCSG